MTDVTLPREIVDRAMDFGDRTATEIHDLGDEVAVLSSRLDAFMQAVGPVIEQYSIDTKARAQARAEADAERLESRSAFAKFATSKVAWTIYSGAAMAAAHYLAGIAGIAPAAVRTALTVGGN